MNCNLDFLIIGFKMKQQLCISSEISKANYIYRKSFFTAYKYYYVQYIYTIGIVSKYKLSPKIYKFVI